MAHGKMQKQYLIGLGLGLLLFCLAPVLSAQESEALTTGIAQTNVNSSSVNAMQIMTIEQVNYANADPDSFVIRIKKQTASAIMLGLGILFGLALVYSLLSKLRKKRDQNLEQLRKQLLEAKSPKETYDLLNAMLKHCYKVSLKASTQSMIQNSLPNATLAAQVVEIMDYMESGTEKDPVYLKKKARAIYRMLAKRG